MWCVGTTHWSSSRCRHAPPGTGKSGSLPRSWCGAHRLGNCHGWESWEWADCTADAAMLKSLENGSDSLEYGGGTTSEQKRLIRLLWTIQVHCCKRRKIGRRQLHVCSRGTYHDLQVTRGAQIPYESDKVSAVSSTFHKKYGLILLLLIKQSTNCRSHWSSSRAGIHIASGSLSISSSSVPSEYFWSFSIKQAHAVYTYHKGQCWKRIPRMVAQLTVTMNSTWSRHYVWMSALTYPYAKKRTSRLQKWSNTDNFTQFLLI